MNKKNDLKVSKGLDLKKLIAICVILLIILCLAFWGVANASEDADNISASLFLKDNKLMFTGFPMLFIGLVAWIYTGDDIKNGIITAKIADGISKQRLFFNKFIALTLITGFTATLFMLIPLLFLCLVFGWGSEFNFIDTLLRFVIMVFPFMRIMAFVCLVLVITKNIVFTLMTGLVDLIVCGIIMEPGVGNAFSTGYANIMALMRYDSYHIYSIKPNVGFVDYYVKQSVFYDSLCLKTLLFSLTITGIYLMAGYCYFYKDPFYKRTTDDI